MKTRPPRRLAWIAMIAIASAITAGLLWRTQHAADSDTDESPSNAIAAPVASGRVDVGTSRAGAGTARRRATAGAAIAETPLPPLDAPFDTAYPDLKRRADAGDANAACRLAAEFDLCDTRRQTLARLDANIRNVGLRRLPPNIPADVRTRMQAGRQRALADFGEQSERALLDLEPCARVPVATPAQRTGYWRAAALGGHLPSLTQYAVGNGFRWREIMQNLPALQIYRDEAEALARRAAAAGDVQASLALAHAYSGINQDSRTRTMLAQVVQPDDVEALALYQRIASRLADDQRPVAKIMRVTLGQAMQSLQQQMTAAQKDEAMARVTRYDAEWRVPETRGALSQRAASDGGLSDLDRAECAVEGGTAP